MYLGLEDKGSVFSILKNWPERRVKAICLTDGQRVGGLGDLGVQVRRLRLRASMQQREPMMVMEARRVRCLSMRPPAVVQAIGVPISRLALYTACGGVVPSACLPITIDAGTDNESLLQVALHGATEQAASWVAQTVAGNSAWLHSICPPNQHGRPSPPNSPPLRPFPFILHDIGACAVLPPPPPHPRTPSMWARSTAA